MGLLQPSGTVELLVRDVHERCAGDDLVAWAVRALVEGFDSPALRMLAGLDGTSWFDAKPLFDRAVGELGLHLPATKEALLRAYVRVLARQVLDGLYRPIDVLEMIHADVLIPLSHAKDLMPWCYLWEGLDPKSFASLTDSQRDEATLQLARQMLESDPTA